MSSIESVLSENRVFPPIQAFKENATISGLEAYQALCKKAEQDYTGFWGTLARTELDWHTPFTQILDESKAPFYRWFYDGKLTVSTATFQPKAKKLPLFLKLMMVQSQNSHINNYTNVFAGLQMRLKSKTSV